MNKNLKIVLILLIFLFCIKYSFAFSNDYNGKGFYSSIADSIGKLEKDMYSIDLAGVNGTKEQINAMLENPCLNSNLSEEDIIKIALENDTSRLLPAISQSCMSSDGTVPISTLNGIVEVIQKFHNNIKSTSIKKTEQIMSIDSTGIYSDGIEGNAPFDLIIDLKNIDKIIFSQGSEESKSYQGDYNVDLGEKIGGLLNYARNSNRTGNNKPGDDINLNRDTNNTYNELKEYKIQSNNVYNNYKCSINSSKSGLDDESLKSIIGNNENKGNYNLNNSSEKYYKIPNLKSTNYSKENDNKVFPCTNFFCIETDFKSYNHELLGGNSKTDDPSIEFLVSRSNNHLKKFVNSSLVGSKMTLNNFELGLKDLDLTNIFQMKVQIISKPVPILNLTNNEKVSKIDEKEKDENSPFGLKSQLKFYYDTYGLDYTRRNDLSLYKKIEVDRQIALNSALLSPNEYATRTVEYDQYTKQKAEQRQLMQRLIANEAKIELLGNFEKQFKELEIFNRSIKDYANNVAVIIGKLLEIPVDSGMN